MASHVIVPRDSKQLAIRLPVFNCNLSHYADGDKSADMIFVPLAGAIDGRIIPNERSVGRTHIRETIHVNRVAEQSHAVAVDKLVELWIVQSGWAIPERFTFFRSNTTLPPQTTYAAFELGRLFGASAIFYAPSGKEHFINLKTHDIAFALPYKPSRHCLNILLFLKPVSFAVESAC